MYSNRNVYAVESIVYYVDKVGVRTLENISPSKFHFTLFSHKIRYAEIVEGMCRQKKGQTSYYSLIVCRQIKSAIFKHSKGPS